MGRVRDRWPGAPKPLERQWWDDRGISPEVRRGRPYGFWADDPQPVREAYAGIAKGQRDSMVKYARQYPGLIIFRHPPPGMGLPPVCPEIRPDEAVVKEVCWHYHPTTLPEEVPCHPATGKPLPRRAIRTANSMAKHIARAKELDDHKGVNDEGVHSHVHRAKYVFPGSPLIERRWSHDHDEAYAGNPDRRAEHVADPWYHDGVDVVGRHSHVGKTKVRDRSEPLARRLDVHPMAWDKFPDARRVFFAIEGCIKADAILSAGEAVFSVPSVTLWHADELSAFAARHLVERLVVIVPDADWFENAAVIMQALLCRSYLQRLGIDACVAAPPRGRIEEGIKGVDDFLGKGRGSIDDLEVLDWQTSTEDEIKDWIRDRSPGLRADRVKRDAMVLQALSLHAGDGGRISSTLSTIARVMDLSADRVEDAARSLAGYGAITVEKGALDTRWGNWRSNEYFDPSLGWVDPPTIEVHPDLRARQRSPQRLAERCSGPPRELLAPTPRIDNTAASDRSARFMHEVLGRSKAQIARHYGQTRAAIGEAIKRAGPAPIPGGVRTEVDLIDGRPARFRDYLVEGLGPGRKLTLARVRRLSPPDVKSPGIEESD